ncbi:MAG: amino acid permease [Planctomycetota bacterium]|nr:amino acid permease [Planctomycetota bacterium]
MADEFDNNQTGGEGEPHLKRVLGPVDATCVVVGAIIGVGIFFTPTTVARIADTGGMAMLAWGVGGIIALLGALTFAELGSMYPNTGGQYQILRDAYGSLTGFIYVFCNATAIQAGAAAIIAVICAEHLGGMVGRENLSTPWVLGLSSILILGLITANILGVRWGSRIQNLTVYAKVVTLLVVAGLAMFVDGASEAVPVVDAASAGDANDANDASGIGLAGLMFAAMIPAFFSFGGWQQALWIAGEVKQPRRNVPLAIVGGVSIVVIVYLLANWAFLHLLGFEGVVGSTTLAADAVATTWGETGRRLIAGAVAISAFGVLNAQFLTGPRLINGMARDGRFFKTFAHVNPKFRTPLAAILLLGGMTFLLLFSAYFFFPEGKSAIDQLLTGVVIIDSTFFAITGFALIILRMKKNSPESPVRLPLFPLIPMLFVLGEIAMLTGSFLTQENKSLFLLALGWMLGAAIFYYVFFRKKPLRISSQEVETNDDEV